jgi:hypothetical protein
LPIKTAVDHRVTVVGGVSMVRLEVQKVVQRSAAAVAQRSAAAVAQRSAAAVAQT